MWWNRNRNRNENKNEKYKKNKITFNFFKISRSIVVVWFFCFSFKSFAFCDFIIFYHSILMQRSIMCERFKVDTFIAARKVFEKTEKLLEHPISATHSRWFEWLSEVMIIWGLVETYKIEKPESFRELKLKSIVLLRADQITEAAGPYLNLSRLRRLMKRA